MIGLLLIYFAAVNTAAWVLFAADKARAREGAWRIREDTLMLFALLGGAPAAWVAMTTLRHKTRKPLFRMGVPLLALLWLALGAFVLVVAPWR